MCVMCTEPTSPFLSMCISTKQKKKKSKEIYGKREREREREKQKKPIQTVEKTEEAEASKRKVIYQGVVIPLTPYSL